ncbi:hypothetical protein HB884_14800 [Listeria booriae]|uniref:hypothetical protein n=1 Tax=Listeria booriae TaxID=1552123 RepID=UPI00162A96C3|nr:hypothetical protein [Listeria booriae]MBC1525476.1 hypothetical protein [Listeria booriae]
MKKRIISMGILLVFSFGLTACGNDSSEKDTKNTASASDTKKEEAKNDGVIARQKYSLNWSDDWKGLKTGITDVSIAKMEKSAMDELGASGEGVIGVKFVLNNTAKIDFNTYPDQATLLVDNQQVDASMLGSDSIGGEILAGAKKEGVVAFVIPKLKDVKSIKKLRLKWSANYETSNYEDDSTKDYDITLDLK